MSGVRDEADAADVTRGSMREFHVPAVTVPTLVRDDETTVLFSVVPVKVPAAAVTVPDPPKEIEVPLTVNELFARFALAIAVPFQVPEVIVPTVVRDDETTALLSVVPDNVPAGAITAFPEAAVS
jgi:hypothetical protein